MKIYLASLGDTAPGLVWARRVFRGCEVLAPTEPEDITSYDALLLWNCERGWLRGVIGYIFPKSSPVVITIEAFAQRKHPLVFTVGDWFTGDSPRVTVFERCDQHGFSKIVIDETR